jgi:hypothetical protein
MSGADVRTDWLRMRDEVSASAMANKQSQEAVLVMIERYRLLSEEERVVVDQLLCEQLASDDETVRFDALALIHEFRITAALPALRTLADWLEAQNSPGAPYEWAKVNRIIGRVTSPRAESKGKAVPPGSPPHMDWSPPLP